MKKLVTSALIYANGPVHIGHLVEYIQTDIYARWCRLLKQDVLYVCADDTHGTPIQINAEKQKIPPQQLIEKCWKEHTTDFSAFHIKFDEYYTTNGDKNREIVEHMYAHMVANGHVYKKDVEQTYCEHCGRFLPDRFVKGKCPKCGAENQYGDACEKCNTTYTPDDLVNPYCVVCGKTPTKKQSSHYFFRLSSFGKRLKDYFAESAFQPEIKNYLLNWIEEGLQDWDFTRDDPYFGFRIPDSDNKYFYVWFDAPVGYIGATKSWCDKNGKSWEDYWKGNESEVIHFIGKDIIYFHFLFWPAMLMAADIPLPKHIQVHGFLNIGGEKMSKSRGTFITGRDFLDRKGDPEYLRFFYATSLSSAVADFDFNEKDYIAAVNYSLIAKYGNLVNRVGTFLGKNYNGRSGNVVDNEFHTGITAQYQQVIDFMTTFEYRKGMDLLFRLIDSTNKYFQDAEPWKIIGTAPDTALTVLTTALSLIKDFTILLSPVLPHYAESIAQMLQVQLDIATLGKQLTGHEIGRVNVPFVKVEDTFVIKNLPEAAKFNLVSAIIREVAVHPEADKLYVCKVDTGAETRTVVAGLRAHYTAEELTGKRVVLLANLKPAKLKGIESNGMMLAASSTEGKVGLLTHGAEPGTPCRFADIEYPDAFEQIRIDEFAAVELYSEGSQVRYAGNMLLCGAETVHADRNISGKVS